MSKEESVQGEFLLGFSQEVEDYCRETLTVDQDGHCRYVLESNMKRPDTPEIGIYATEISAEEARTLHDRMLDLKGAELPPPREMKSGEPIYHVFLEENGARQERDFDPVNVPERHQVIARQVLKLKEEALKHSLSVMQVAVSFDPVQVDREAPLLVKVTFSAAGTERFNFFNPLMLPDGADGKLVIGGERSDLEPEEIYQHHRQAQQLRYEQLDTTASMRFRNEQILDLAPGSSVSLVIETVLDWPPGPYNVHAYCRMLGEAATDYNRVAGCVSSLPQQLVVTGKSKPTDEAVEEDDAADKPPGP